MLNHIAYQDQFLPAALIIAATTFFFVYERVAPGRQLPELHISDHRSRPFQTNVAAISAGS
jgi:hypothetical protein